LRAEKLTLQQIVRMGSTAYACPHRLPDAGRRAVWALLVCRTARLGGHVQACPDGPVERIWYHACRHRTCPHWAWGQIDRWLAKQQARRLACEHYHVLFTIPHERNDLWLANVAVRTQRLCASVHDTLWELLGDPQYLGARPGIIAPLHTWPQPLLRHPHLHGLVTGGGRHEAGPWVAVRNGFLRPMRVVMARFRGKLRAAIRHGGVPGTLQLPAGQSRQPGEQRLNKLGRQQWSVQSRERSPHGHGGLISLARDLRGGPIAPQRVVAWDGQQVVFGYTERATGSGGQAHPRTRRLAIEQVIGRGRLHVPPAGAVRVRCWGL
jgi:hypothetical protein